MDEFASYQSFAQVYDEFMDQTPYRLWGENIRQYLAPKRQATSGYPFYMPRG